MCVSYKGSRRFSHAEFRGLALKGHTHWGRRKGRLPQPIIRPPAADAAPAESPWRCNICPYWQVIRKMHPFSLSRWICLHHHSRKNSKNSFCINCGLISDIHALFFPFVFIPWPPHLTPFSVWTLYSFSPQIMERVQDQPFWTDPHLLFHSLFNMGLFFSLHSSSPFLTLSSFGFRSCAGWRNPTPSSSKLDCDVFKRN